ncbi:MAG: flagellar biosynthesis protein FlhA [Myxococcota bacterium]|nr:flagellar biosynthesis protein FlhA [Myxococcota bacterium]
MSSTQALGGAGTTSQNQGVATRPDTAVAKPVTTPARGGPQVPASEGPFGVESVFAVAMVAILGIMIFPLPPVMLDLLLGLSVSLSLVVYLLSMNVQKALDLSSFPSILLVLTLMRLALNVASTRLILTKGDQGPEAVSKVISAFGHFVVGGNYVVGIIVFLILVLVNFVVITKGSGRIAEVAARFTLDGMPGKQMAIDADLASGLIGEEEAKTRRAEVEQESTFYGAMDGAAKFVRGDAIAGLVITAINIVGGLIIGVAQQDMSAGEAAQVYTTLTVGDGLVSQIPSLLTSAASGLIVTRTSTKGSLGATLREQMFSARRPAALASGMLAVMAFVPGMPSMVFLTLAALMGGTAFLKKQEMGEQELKSLGQVSRPEAEQQEIVNLLPLDLLEIEVGYELVTLVDADRDGSLLRRITGIRRQLAQEFGIIVPPIHMRDNLRLRPGEYRVLLSGNEIGRGELRVGRLMAMNPGGGAPTLNGEACVEPAFGLAARWITPADQDRAEMLGYTVVDPATVAATHLGEVLAANAYQLLGRREFQDLCDLHAKDNAKVIEELLPGILTHGQVIKVLRNLLMERVSVRDFRSILESLADNGTDIKDPAQLTELVRQSLSSQLTARHAGGNGAVYGIALSPEVENTFRRLQSPGVGGVLSPDDLQQILVMFNEATSRLPETDTIPVILTSADIRRSVSTFVVRHMPGLAVLSYREIDPKADVKTVGVVGVSASDAEIEGSS